MPMRELLAFWENVEKRGGRPQAVYGLFSDDVLTSWTVNRRQARKEHGNRSGICLIKLAPP
jgi:hypothetical protein